MGEFIKNLSIAPESNSVFPQVVVALKSWPYGNLFVHHEDFFPFESVLQSSTFYLHKYACKTM